MRALPFVLVVPLVVLSSIAYAISEGRQGDRLPVAQGAIGGSFHPVAGDFKPDATVLEECEGRYSCLEQAFGNIAYRSGPKRTLAIFEARIRADRVVQRDCHRIAHTIGSAVFARNDGNVARTFAEGSSVCASGYYHGILERAFVGTSTAAALSKKARTLCLDPTIRRRGFLDYQCRHGLGHGFMIQTGYDLPTALSLCGNLGTGWDEVTCTSGVFMENVSTRFGFRSRWLRESDPLYPCTSLERRYRASCYLRATTWVLELNQYDFADTARRCASVGSAWTPYCFRGYGRDAVVDARYESIRRVLALCRLAGSGRGACFYGAARTFGDGEGLAGARRAAAFCARAPRVYRGECSAGLGIVLGLLYPTDAGRRAACARLAPQHAADCARGATVEVDPSGRQAWG
ncbi:MAG TPA: hypothetical protein VFR38_15915 [Gaiellaceae bacterium]|nr:hypothetical protein [Gaiellaceae bacterium]